MISYTRELSNHSMCMKNPRKTNSTNRRRASRYSEENEKQHHIFHKRRDTRTVNMTSSHTETSQPGAFVWGEGWLATTTHGLSGNRSVHENKPWKRSSKNKNARLYNSNEQRKQHNISAPENIRTVYMTTFAQNNAPSEALRWGEGWWSTCIKSQTHDSIKQTQCAWREAWKTKFKE